MTLDNFWFEAILILALIFANGFFAASEIAMIAMRKSRIDALVEKGVKAAAAVARLKRRSRPVPRHRADRRNRGQLLRLRPRRRRRHRLSQTADRRVAVSLGYPLGGCHRADDRGLADHLSFAGVSASSCPSLSPCGIPNRSPASLPRPIELLARASARSSSRS